VVASRTVATIPVRGAAVPGIGWRVNSTEIGAVAAMAGDAEEIIGVVAAAPGSHHLLPTLPVSVAESFGNDQIERGSECFLCRMSEYPFGAGTQ
jgi:hypothetical protein